MPKDFYITTKTSSQKHNMPRPKYKKKSLLKSPNNFIDLVKFKHTVS